jgi:hypothetical protein
MRLFSNYLVILVLMIIWPALLLLFLVFSAWLDRFAARPPKWVLRQQAAAKAREDALRSAAEAPVAGRTRYWHPPRAAKAGREQPAGPPPAVAPKPAPQAITARAAAVRQPARPDGQGRRAAIDEATEPMAGFPVDRLPPEPPAARRRRPPPRPVPGAGVPVGRDLPRP